jgi:dTDP-4-dehydrorhamnose reductase
LIIGANGQVGRSLVRTAPSHFTIEAVDRSQLDLADTAKISAKLTQTRPAIVINAGAYTAVDRAETEQERAFAVNALAVATLANSCASAGVKLIHLSTDYVFDGRSPVAYEPDAATHPINVYGASKLAGEQAIAQTNELEWIIVRTSWVYAPWGTNFLLTMLRLMRERDVISVVNDQIGAPTNALSLARFLWRAAALPKAHGIFHYADAGAISWYEFAVAINEEATAAGLLQRPTTIRSITTAEYPTPAKRPAFSLLATRSSLATAAFEAPQWRTSLREALLELTRHE